MFMYRSDERKSKCYTIVYTIYDFIYLNKLLDVTTISWHTIADLLLRLFFKML